MEDNVTKKKKQPKCVIYTRFSPRRNADECTSAVQQESICREWAAENGLEVKAVFSDLAVSGNKWPREGLSNALSSLSRGDTLLVWKLDRIARDVWISEMVHHVASRRRAEVRSVDDGDVHVSGPAGKLLRRLLAWAAEFEREQISARTRIMQRRKQRSGRKVGRFPPYGYKFGGPDGKDLVQDPREQPALEAIRWLADRGLTPYKIARRMDMLHPELARGKEWGATTIKTILDRKIDV
jgi:DNA invertase Pin-like site-specific DNA recombinase